jgi:hypothetical protein
VEIGLRPFSPQPAHQRRQTFSSFADPSGCRDHRLACTSRRDQRALLHRFQRKTRAAVVTEGCPSGLTDVAFSDSLLQEGTSQLGRAEMVLCMTEDEHRAEIVAVDRQTSVAVSSSQVVLSFPVLHGNRTSYAVISAGFGIAAAVLLAFASGAIPGLPGSGSPFQLALCGVAAAMTSCAAAGACFSKRRVEVTTSEIRIPGPVSFVDSRLLRSSLTEAHITTFGGSRCLVLATPTQRAMLQQRMVHPEDWNRLVSIVGATET